MKKEKREIALKLRKTGFSIREIAKELSVSTSSVSLWVREIVLTDKQLKRLENKQSINLEKMRQSKKAYSDICRKKRVEWQIEGAKRIEDIRFMAGCMLYWGEGSKTCPSMTIITNSDPDIITFFINFLNEQFGIKPSELKAFINCHLDHGLTYNEIREYWSELCKIPISNFYKPKLHEGVERTKGKHKKLKYGTMQIRLSNVAVTQMIFGGIQKFAQVDKPEWLR